MAYFGRVYTAKSLNASTMPVALCLGFASVDNVCYASATWIYCFALNIFVVSTHTILCDRN